MTWTGWRLIGPANCLTIQYSNSPVFPADSQSVDSTPISAIQIATDTQTRNRLRVFFPGIPEKDEPVCSSSLLLAKVTSALLPHRMERDLWGTAYTADPQDSQSSISDKQCCAER